LHKVLALRETALSLDGYAVVLNGPEDMEIDPWGYSPGTLPLMRRLKALNQHFKKKPQGSRHA